MKLKEKILKEIEDMDIESLQVLAEQMEILKKKRKKKVKHQYTKEQIRQLLSSSKTEWSKDIIKDRKIR